MARELKKATGVPLSLLGAGMCMVLFMQQPIGAAARCQSPKNVIVMISDGCGFNHVAAAGFVRHGQGAGGEARCRYDGVGLVHGPQEMLAQVMGVDEIGRRGAVPRGIAARRHFSADQEMKRCNRYEQPMPRRPSVRTVRP
jgi:hypothetical protein